MGWRGVVQDGKEEGLSHQILQEVWVIGTFDGSENGEVNIEGITEYAKPAFSKEFTLDESESKSEDEYDIWLSSEISIVVEK